MKIRLGALLLAALLSSTIWAQSPPRLRTPVVENQGQIPAAELARQASAFAGDFFLEGPGERKLIALTFDDGPSADTPALLDVLKQHNVKATFFWLGRAIEANPELARRAVAEGHTLGNHSFDHPRLSDSKDAGWWDAQLARTQDIFQRELGFKPALMRPPYGFLRDDQVKALAERGIKSILWSVDSSDWFYTWKQPDDEARTRIGSTVLDYAHPEAIVLMHDAGGRTRKPTVAATDDIITRLKAQGYQFVTVDQLLGVPARLK